MARPPLYPFDKLGIGDTFDIPFELHSDTSIRMLCWRNGKRLGRSFAYRFIGTEGVFRVERVTPQERYTPEVRRGEPFQSGRLRPDLQEKLEQRWKELGFD